LAEFGRHYVSPNECVIIEFAGEFTVLAPKKRQNGGLPPPARGAIMTSQ
jgi:hypothetical protein